jgi:hypothetical protein
MKTKTTTSRKVSRSKLTPAAGTETLTRAEVAKALGCSIPTVRRMEGTTLHPTEDAEGVHRFDPVEVIHLVHDRSARAVDPSKEGERDARVFEMLDTGKGVREIVTTLRLPVEVALKLADQWRDAGRRDLVVPPVCRAELEQCLGSAKDAAELTQLIRSLEAERERLGSENEMMSNRMGGIIAIVGEIAARNSDVEEALSDLKNELDAEQIEMLDRGFKYHQQRLASAIRVSAELRDEGEHRAAR